MHLGNAVGVSLMSVTIAMFAPAATHKCKVIGSLEGSET